MSLENIRSIIKKKKKNDCALCNQESIQIVQENKKKKKLSKHFTIEQIG